MVLLLHKMAAVALDAEKAMQHFPIQGCMVLAALAVLGDGGHARAVIPSTKPPIPQRVALADCVVVGKVKALEAGLLRAAPSLKIPGVGKIPYQIAVLSVQAMIVGDKEQKEIRVGYAPPGSGVPGRYRRYAQIELVVNQEGCFFLRKHPDEAFWIAQASYDLMDKATEKNYSADLALVKRCARLLEAPGAGLQAKEGEDRRLTAAMLLFRYRTPRQVYDGKPPTESIDHAQSKLILAALQTGDWSEEAAASPMAPLNLFLWLGLTEADGWTEPASPKDYPAAAQKWLRDNADRYRIQRYVPEPKSGK
jgi:hypothetical protein